MRALLMVLALGLAGCETLEGERDEGEEDLTPAAATDGPSAYAQLATASGETVGRVVITEADDGLRVVARADGLQPGTYAIHVHQTGQCNPDFSAAGDHWNPTNTPHGFEVPGGPHKGDLPNLVVGSDRTGSISYTVPQTSLSGAMNPILDADGAAVIVHAGADDYRSQPAGASGSRLACGVVQAGVS